jgi:hypothetical protein
MAADAAEARIVGVNTLPIQGRVYGVAAIDGAFLFRTGKRLIRIGEP